MIGGFLLPSPRCRSSGPWMAVETGGGMSIIGRLEHDLAALAGPLRTSLDELSPATLVELGRKIDERRQDLDGLAQELKKWATTHPEPIFAILRRVQPILIVRD